MKKYFLAMVGVAMLIFASAQTSVKAIATKTEKDVIPEGIAVDPATGTIYVSSIALKKIIAINKNGSHKDFVKTGQDEILEVLGMKIDPKKKWLWAVSNQKQGAWFVSQVHAFDFKTGQLKQKFVLKDTVRHLFNDLILHTDGKVYITDTYGSSIYKVDPQNQKLTLFIRDSMIAYPNGIACNKKGKVYLATYSHGLMQLDPGSKSLTPLKGYIDSKMAYNLDGLVYWNNSIIGIYNAAESNKDNAVVQYILNDDGDKITGEKIVDKGNGLFAEPTTAAVVANKLYVLANSYLAAFNKNKESVEGITDKLGSVVILVYDLK